METNFIKVSPEMLLEKAKALVKGYPGFLSQCPKMLRESMQLSYQTAVDDMLKALDESIIGTPVKHQDTKKVILVDENGYPA